MSDFYSVLKQSLIDRDLRSAAERGEAYEQARTALIQRLWSTEPALTDDEIDGRIARFDKAVERIEDELSKIFADTTDRVAPRPDAPPKTEGVGDTDAYYSAAIGRPTPPRSRRAKEGGPAQPSDERSVVPPEERSRVIEAALRTSAAKAATDASMDVDDGDAELPPWLGEAWTDPGAEDLAEGSGTDHEGARSAAGRIAAWRPRLPASERQRVRWLIGAIALLVIALVAVTVYILLPAASLNDDAPAGDAAPVEGVASDPADAARIPTDPLEVEHTFTLFNGSDPTVFASDPDNPIRYDGGAPGGGMVRISTSTGSSGARAIIGPGLSARLAGRTVRVLIMARSSAERGAGSFRFAYQSGVAISHWQAAKLTADYASFGLVWRVPALTTDPTGNWIIVEPGIPGDGTAVDIQSIKIDLIAPDATGTD